MTVMKEVERPKQSPRVDTIFTRMFLVLEMRTRLLRADVSTSADILKSRNDVN